MIAWKITALSFRDRGLPGEVSEVHWRCEAASGENDARRVGACYGSVGLPPADPDRMLPLDELTEDHAMRWLRARLRGRMADIEAEAQARLAALDAPPPPVPAWLAPLAARDDGP